MIEGGSQRMSRDSKESTRRRRLLQAIAGISILSALSGCADTNGPDDEPHDDANDTPTDSEADTSAIERGPIADRPSEGAYDDYLFAATDQRILWRWDGDENDWEAFAGLGIDGDPVDELFANAIVTESTKTDTIRTNQANNIGLGNDLSLPIDHDDSGADSIRISWDTPSHWEYSSGEFQSLLETSYAAGGGYGISGHWQIMSAHHYGPAFGMLDRPDVHCPIHVFGSEPDGGAAEFSITWGDYHNRRQRMWLSKAGGAMLEEDSPAAEFSVLRDYVNQSVVTHLALTPNYLREEDSSGQTNITEDHTPIEPGTFRFRGVYWDGGLQTARMLQMTPSMDADAHQFHVALEVENEDSELIETGRIDHTGTWEFADLRVSTSLSPPSVETEADLPDDDVSEPSLMWVSSEQQWYTFTESDGWVAGNM